MPATKKQLPKTCPSCQSQLEVSRLHCPECDTTVEGNFAFPKLSQLNEEEQEFVLSFVKFSGSLKKMAQHMDRSYPSVRNRLDEIIDRIEKIGSADGK